MLGQDGRPISVRTTPYRLLLVGIYVFVGATLAGFGTFGLHPELLGQFPRFAPLYAPIYRWAGQAQVWVAGAVLLTGLALAARDRRWLAALAACYALSLAAELAGTTWGLPFGGYGYSPLLGPQWLDRVPVVVPLSWFCMAVPSFALAGHALRGRARLARLLFGAALLTAWDVALDPAMSHLTRFWIWADTGPFFGMPWVNLLGWYVTGLALMAVLEWSGASRWADRLPPGWHAAYYGANLAMPLGMLVAAGLWVAVGASVGTYLLLGAIAAVLRASWAGRAAPLVSRA